MKKICVFLDAAGLPVCPRSNEAYSLDVIFSPPNCPLVGYSPDVEPDTGNEFFNPLVSPSRGMEVDWNTVEWLRR